MATKAVPTRKRKWPLASIFVLTAGVLCTWSIWNFVLPGSVARGRAAYSHGDWDMAAKLSRERLQIAKDDPKALQLMARASARLGRFAEAGGFFARMQTRDLEVEDHYLFGLALARTGQFDAAQMAWRYALSVEPGHQETLLQMARLAFDRGQMVEAERAAGRLAHQPGGEVSGDLLLGMIMPADHDPQAATEALRRALRRDPQARLVPSVPYSTQKLLVRTLLQTGRSAEACELAQVVLAAGPDREASWLLSRAHLQAGAPAQSLPAMAQAGTYRSDFPMEPEPCRYVGESRCAECHRSILQSLLASRHARTLLKGEELSSLPLPDHPLADPDEPNASHAYKWAEGRIQVETRVQSRVFQAVVDYALGAADRYTSLIGRDVQGEARTFRLSRYHNARESGWDRTKNQPPHPVRDEDLLGEPFNTAEGVSECLSCHTTTVRSVREGSGPESHDKGIGCERCHGPGELHLTAIRTRLADPFIASPAHAAPGAINNLCGKCHAQHFLAMPAARSDPAWARFPSSNMPWSRCYTESGGALHCVTCHDPHRDAETSSAHYEAKCLSCHLARSTPSSLARTDQEPQAFRSPCPVNPTRNCLQCHMPKVAYQQLHTLFTDHFIRVPATRSQARR